MIAQVSLKKSFSLIFGHTSLSATRYYLARKPKDPRPALPDNDEPREKPRPRPHGQALILEPLGLPDAILAILDNYHLPRKNACYHLVILRWHLWGGRFQMSVMGERQVTGWIGRGPSGQEGLICSI